MLYPCIFVLTCQWICLFCMFDSVRLLKQFAICIMGVFVILLLNVMELLSVIGGVLLDMPCMVFHRMCCACGLSERLDAPSKCFCLCFCMSAVISSFRSLRAGSQVFALLILFLFVILHNMSLGKSLHLLCIFGMVCLSVCENSVGSVYIGVYGGLSKSELCVFRELCPVSCLVVGEYPSILL